MKPTRSRRVGGKNLVEFLPTHRHQATTTEVADAGWVEHIHKDRTSAEACQTCHIAREIFFCIVEPRLSSFIWRISFRLPMTNQTLTLAMTQWDVFSSNPLEGNSLAVFPDARGLSDTEMQALAKEMNLSETTFVFPRDSATEREAGVRVRIFTVQEELPFAGHPTLGTAFALRGDSGAEVITLDLNVGKVPVKFEESPGQPTFGEMTQIDPVFVMQHDREGIARATGLSREDFDASLPIETVSTGVPFTVAPLRSLAVMQNLRVDAGKADEYLQKSGGKFLYFVCRQTVDPSATLHARMIFYNGEDPATGSAAGCTAAWMVAHGVAEPDRRVLIEQGMEMQRPSRIFVRAAKRDNRIVNVRVGGNAVEVIRGEVFL
jgi:trans-2,3-dihydro-3-hydroxyanthranilate isomerase